MPIPSRFFATLDSFNFDEEAESDEQVVTAKEEASLDDMVHHARKLTNTEPSQAQKQSGNYAKGKFKCYGLTIAIENPRGSLRSGKSKDGTEWSMRMPNDYGYILRTNSEADNDHIDVFLGPHLESDKVFVVDQMRADGGDPDGHDNVFDEHKVMLGFDTADDAERAYKSAYVANWKGFGGVSEVSVPEFKEWVFGDKTALPFAKYLKANEAE